MVRSAVLEMGCDRTVVWWLLAGVLRATISARLGKEEEGCGDTDFSFRDAVLWSWAGRVRAGDAGGDGVGDGGASGKGEWLLSALRYAADAAAGNSVYDAVTHEDFVRACGKIGDGVEEVSVPLWFQDEEGWVRDFDEEDDAESQGHGEESP